MSEENVENPAETEVRPEASVEITTEQGIEDLRKQLEAEKQARQFEASARIASEKKWMAPVITEDLSIAVEGGRHPVVERFIDTPFVPNDLMLDDARRMLIITGPNMGGKSTYMRQAALIVILAHAGSFVPARAATIGVVDRLFFRPPSHVVDPDRVVRIKVTKTQPPFGTSTYSSASCALPSFASQ